jgi:hypothetical protein
MSASKNISANEKVYYINYFTKMLILRANFMITFTNVNFDS